MDVVYVLGKGSTWDNNELRYSLRSFAKFYRYLDRVYIIGERPSWIQNVTHIYLRDEPGIDHKEFNIYNKILKACNTPSVSDDFIFANDDHFLLQPLIELPFYYHTTLEDSIATRTSHDHYYHSLQNTFKVLKKLYYMTLNFDCHCPILYNKRKFINAMDGLWNNVPYGYVIKSLYANQLQGSKQQMEDLKINVSLNAFELEKLTKGRKFFSIGDRAINPHLKMFLDYLYPNPSPFER